MGNITVTGPGYDGIINENCENDEVGNPIACANAGNLLFSNSTNSWEESDPEFFLTTGYSMWVQTGQTYNLTGLEWKGDIYFAFSDIELPRAEGIDPTDEYVDLNLHLNGLTRTCRIDAGHPRKWLTSKGIGFNYDLSACTMAFAEMGLQRKFFSFSQFCQLTI